VELCLDVNRSRQKGGDDNFQIYGSHFLANTSIVKSTLSLFGSQTRGGSESGVPESWVWPMIIAETDKSWDLPRNMGWYCR
jgi:hypothetical protein